MLHADARGLWTDERGRTTVDAAMCKHTTVVRLAMFWSGFVLALLVGSFASRRGAPGSSLCLPSNCRHRIRDRHLGRPRFSSLDTSGLIGSKREVAVANFSIEQHLLVQKAHYIRGRDQSNWRHPSCICLNRRRRQRESLLGTFREQPVSS